MHKDSIIYVNFSPYENAGKILDYLLQNFKLLALFSFSFHRLKNKRDTNKLKVYRNGRLVETYDIFDYQFPERFIFVFLPLRSLLIFLQLFFYCTYLKVKYGQFDYYFTVNAFTAWVGFIIKKLGVVKKTIFWVWDYYPPIHPNRVTAFMRWVYWQFDKLGTQSDTLVFLNKRLARLREDIGELDRHTKYKVIPIGTTVHKKRTITRVNPKNGVRLVFFGVVKKSQGLDLIFDHAKQISDKFPGIKLHIIGGGPDLNHFKNKASKIQLKTVFYEYLEDKLMNKIFSKCNIGIATYIPVKDNVAYYGDPSKIKQYLSHGIPVVTTNVFDFSVQIKKNNAGIVLNKYSINDFIKAITKIEKNLPVFSKNAYQLSKKYDYNKLYKEFFE